MSRTKFSLAATATVAAVVAVATVGVQRAGGSVEPDIGDPIVLQVPAKPPAAAKPVRAEPRPDPRPAQPKRVAVPVEPAASGGDQRRDDRTYDRDRAPARWERLWEQLRRHGVERSPEWGRDSTWQDEDENRDEDGERDD